MKLMIPTLRVLALALLCAAWLPAQSDSEPAPTAQGDSEPAPKAQADMGKLLPQPALERPSIDFTALRRLPVLENERYQPLDSAARSHVRQITGKERFRKTDPMLVLMHWMMEPEVARGEAWIELPKREAAEILGIVQRSKDRQHVSYDYLKSDLDWTAKVGELKDRQKNGENLGLVELEAIRLLSRVNLFHVIMGLAPGTSLNPDRPWTGLFPAIPPAEAPAPGMEYQWLSPVDAKGGNTFLSQRADGSFPNPKRWSDSEFAPIEDALSGLAAAWEADDGAAFTKHSEALVREIAALGYPQLNPDFAPTDPKNKLAFPGMEKIDREIRLNKVRPFFWSRFGYLMALIFFLFAVPFRGMKRLLPWSLGGIILLATVAFHAWGLMERTSVSGRAMIGNLYESLIFVTAAGAALSLLVELFHRRGWFGVGGTAAAFIGLWSASAAPDFLRPEISNLQPVLINNDLIHIHVPTIMTSYAVLGVAAILAHIWLVIWWFQRPAKKVVGSADAAQHGAWFAMRPRTETQRDISQCILWAIPVGSILLFVGIILGGVWADMSWGRFWGWDSKETSSLILWLWFMAVVHGRWAGWLRDVGVALTTMVGGVLLMWTYVGTNLFLRGLHSYAGTSGSEISVPAWVWFYVAVEAGFIGVTFLVLKARNASESLVGRSESKEAPENSSANPHGA